jgi:hypothetical protein
LARFFLENILNLSHIDTILDQICHGIEMIPDQICHGYSKSAVN